jgi:hypothetical protein
MSSIFSLKMSLGAGWISLFNRRLDVWRQCISVGSARAFFPGLDKAARPDIQHPNLLWRQHKENQRQACQHSCLNCEDQKRDSQLFRNLHVNFLEAVRPSNYCSLLAVIVL